MKLTRKLLIALLAVVCCVAFVSCNPEPEHECKYEYRWRNIDGVNTYQKGCNECGYVENLNPSKALLINGEDFATAVCKATNDTYYGIRKIEFKGNCAKPTGLAEELIVSVDTSPYEAWIDWEVSTGIITIKTDADVFMLNENCMSMFDNDYLYSSYSLEQINFNHLLDTSAVKSFEYFLYDNYVLESIDLSDFDTSNAEQMDYMFYECNSIRNLDLSSFNTSNVVNMSCMFAYCTNLKNLDLSNFNTSNLEKLSQMFYCCYTLQELDLSSFNTKNIDSLYQMFDLCFMLERVDLSSFNTAKVRTFEGMFYECYHLKNLTLGSGFSLESATTTYQMFCDFAKSVGQSLKPGESIDVITGIPASQIDELLDYVDDFHIEDCSWSKSGDSKITLSKAPIVIL